MIEKLYTVEEVAELASVTGRTIRNYLKSGRLVGRKIGGQWRFPESEVQRLLTGGEPSAESAADVVDTNISIHSEPSPIQTSEPVINEPVYQQSTNNQVVYAEPPVQPEPPLHNGVEHPNTAYTHPILPQNPSPQFSEPSPVAQQNYFAETAPVQHPDSVIVQEPAFRYSPPSPGPLPKAEPVNQNVIAQETREPFAGNVYTERAEYAPKATYMQRENFQREMPVAQPAPPIYNTPYTPQYPAEYEQMNQAPVYSDSYNYNQTYNSNQQNPPIYTQPAAMPQYYPSAQYQYAGNPGSAEAYGNANATGGKNIVDTPKNVNTTPPQAHAKVPAETSKSAQNTNNSEFPVLSEIGKKVARFVSEVHECSRGPQVCSVIDMHQSLDAARHTSEKLAEIALQESESGISCQSFVEFDERYYVARYTLFGSSEFLYRCIKLIG